MKSRIKQPLTMSAKAYRDYCMMIQVVDDNARQTLSAVLYALHLTYSDCKPEYRKRKVREIYNSIKGIIKFPKTPQGQINGLELMEFINKEYGIDLDEITMQVETPEDVLKRKK